MPLDRIATENFVNDNIRKFHNNRLAKLERINLRDILKRKNPYLFRAKDMQSASDIVESMLDALLSSSEEKMFGDFLEQLAIFVSEQTSGGRKSSAPGIDLEFERTNTIYLVSIKSGPNWGNSSQYQALETNFKKAVVVQRQGTDKRIQPVLGICYGRTQTSDKGVYQKITGQNFWHFVSGDKNLYTDIIEPIGHKAAEHNAAYHEKRAALVKELSVAFANDFCDADGNIDWHKLVEFNSGNYE